MKKEEPPAILVVLVFCVKGTFAFSVCCGVTVSIYAFCLNSTVSQTVSVFLIYSDQFHKENC